VRNLFLIVSGILGVLLAPGLTPAYSQGTASPPLAAVINLENRLQGQSTATVDVGGGVALKLSAGRGAFRQNLTILADGREVQKLEGGKFFACARLEAGSVTYWSISEFTGGAHCCGQFAFLARAAAGQPVRYLGQTRGYDGGPLDFPGTFIARQGQLYFQGFDNWFDYFHTSHAGSLLVNVPRIYYRLTPTSLTVDNLPFKDAYLGEAAAVDQEIRRQAAPQVGKAQAIFKPGSGPGFDNLVFSDDLGQLLVKRTILYLYARADQKAWDTLSRDVERFYRTSTWVPELKQEIYKTLREHPY
jgi:hypothetical protein